MLLLPYRLGTDPVRLRRGMLRNIRVTAALLAALGVLVAVAMSREEGFPYPWLAIMVVAAGLLWSLAGFVTDLLALYPATRTRMLPLWGISFGLNALSVYVFFSLAAMY